jgi:glycerophosphoryl diester phosphodiesterase
MDAAGRPHDFTAARDARTYAELARAPGLAEIASYADGIGVDKRLILPRDVDQKLLAATSLVSDAHAAGLLVHAWTFRRENSFLPADFHGGDPSAADHDTRTGDLRGEITRFLELGLDGLFSDNPDLAVAARNRFEVAQRRERARPAGSRRERVLRAAPDVCRQR